MKFSKLLFALFFASFSFSNLFADVYEIEPNLDNCNQGKLSVTEKTRVLNLINNIRKRHKMAPVTWATDKEGIVQAASLSIVATNIMSHDPVTGKCSSTESDKGRAGSNLSYGYQTKGMPSPDSDEHIIGWLIDDKSASSPEVVGHRRLILNPYLKQTCFGRVDGPHKNNANLQATAAALWGIDSTNMGTSTSEINFVAYPYENYPISWVNKSFYLSFSPIVNTNTWYPFEQCDFSKAQITMKDENNSSIIVNDIRYDYEAWGCFKNNISWKANNLKDNVKYTVKITNITVNNVAKEYEYWFKLTDDIVAPLAEVPTLVLPANNAQNIESPVIFKWNKAKNAEYYRIQGSLSSTFTSIAFDIDTLIDTTFALSGLSGGIKYYWRVAAYNIDSISSEYSAVWSFNIIPDPPIAIYPEANNINVDKNSKFIWKSVNEATYYNLQIATSNNFENASIVVNKEQITDTIYTLTESQILQSFTNYYWRINANFANGNKTNWTTAIPFKTNDSISSINETFANTTISCFPNPFTSRLNIIINSDAANKMKLEVYNSLGIVVEVIFDGMLEIGENSFTFNPNDIVQGTYFCKITINDNSFKIVSLNYFK